MTAVRLSALQLAALRLLAHRTVAQQPTYTGAHTAPTTGTLAGPTAASLARHGLAEIAPTGSNDRRRVSMTAAGWVRAGVDPPAELPAPVPVTVSERNGAAFIREVVLTTMAAKLSAPTLEVLEVLAFAETRGITVIRSLHTRRAGTADYPDAWTVGGGPTKAAVTRGLAAYDEDTRIVTLTDAGRAVRDAA